MLFGTAKNNFKSYTKPEEKNTVFLNIMFTKKTKNIVVARHIIQSVQLVHNESCTNIIQSVKQSAVENGTSWDKGFTGIQCKPESNKASDAYRAGWMDE